MAEANPSPSVLEMEDVAVSTLRNPDHLVLENVDWTVRAGEFWAVVGLNRSGKSDLMAMAAGLMAPARGRYRVFGHDFVAAFEEGPLTARRRLGLVFDGGQMIHHLTVTDNVALPIRYHQNLSESEAAPQVQVLLELTGLTPWAGKTSAALSRNWQQRVGLARALALKPEVLLLDGPLTGLDPRDAAWWLDLLARLSAGHAIMDHRPTTLVVTGDDLRPWQGRVSHSAVLRNKRFIPLGTHPGTTPHDEALIQEML